MTGYLIDYRGAAYELPPILSWDMRHTRGNPADAFEIRFLYGTDMLGMLRDAARFRAVHEGEIVFFGVVDEFEIVSDSAGMTVSVRGRGLAALLMDNEAEAAQYFSVGAQFILDRHVYPFGISEVRFGELPKAASFVIASGESQWSVLENFAWFIGGVRPRFSRDGVLILRHEVGDTLLIDEKTGVSRVVCREQRYGEVSQVIVKNRVWGISAEVENREFIERGGCARRVVNVPRYTGHDVMRYTGEYQIARSKEHSVVVEITLPELFAAFPGDRVELAGGVAGTGISGEFAVSESRCSARAERGETVLTLLKE